jgi:hypothetical protein
MADVDPKLVGGNAIRPLVVRDQLIGNKVEFPKKFAHQFHCRMLVALGRKWGFQAMALSSSAFG